MARVWQILALTTATMAALASGCASVSIDSNPPDADVIMILPGEETERNLGKTPFRSDLSSLSEAVNEGAVTLVVRKRGYLSQHFLVPNVPHMDLKLETHLLPDLPRNYEEVNKVVGSVLKGQRFLLQKRYPEALQTAAEIKKVSENIASAYEIEGSAYFLTSKFREARYAWMKVLDLEPENHDAKTMLRLVETRMGFKGGRAPAQSAPERDATRAEATPPADAAPAKPAESP